MKMIHSLTMTIGVVALAGACDPAVKAEARQKSQSRQNEVSTKANLASGAPIEVALNDAPSKAENDARIEAGFKKTWIYTKYLENEKISIQSKNGAVTLTGSVGDSNQIRMAGHTAEALPGVSSVDNKIVFAGDPVPTDSDLVIRSKVKSVLLFHRNVSASKTDVEVLQGKVTLRGEAMNAAQKDLTTEYAKDVEGVVDVNNEMTLAAVPQDSAAPPSNTETTVKSVTDMIDDASITAQIRMSLLFHRSTSAMNTKVSTKDGTVTVGGEAKNSAEIDLVTKLVNDINGVKMVINNMTVTTAVSKSD